MERWEIRIEADNEGKPLKVWSWLDYELCLNVNLRDQGGWVFELTRKGRHLALATTLAGGKEAALEHHETGATRDRLEAVVGAQA